MQTDVLPIIYKVISSAEHELSQVIGKKVTLKLDVKDDLLTPTDALRMSVQQMVCAEFGVPWSAILAAKRNNFIVDARRAYCYLAKKVLGDTLSDIASDLNRHHTSVMHHCQRAEDLIETNDPAGIKIINIKNKLYEDCNQTKA